MGYTYNNKYYILMENFIKTREGLQYLLLRYPDKTVLEAVRDYKNKLQQNIN